MGVDILSSSMSDTDTLAVSAREGLDCDSKYFLRTTKSVCYNEAPLEHSRLLTAGISTSDISTTS